MSQERWDVVLRFLGGPLSFQGDVTCRGPVVRIGSAPGPGGLALAGYRGLDNRQAVISCYEGGAVSLAPVGANQVRTATHEHVDWASLDPIRGPVYLSPGDAFHLGPPERGCTVSFISAQRLGVWQKGAIRSEAGHMHAAIQPSNVKELSTTGGRPEWFLPSLLGITMLAITGISLPLLSTCREAVEPLGPIMEGAESYDFVEATEPVDPELAKGINQPFLDFVMQPNADVAGMSGLGQAANWDQTFFDYVTRSVKLHALGSNFWKRLDQVVDSYAYVVLELRDQKLPEVFAASPYQVLDDCNVLFGGE